MPTEDDNGEPDLSGVLPERRETVRRRIAAIEEYDAMDERHWHELNRLCESVGLSPATFNRLWRSWRILRDPAALQGPRQPGGLRNALGDADHVRRLLAELPEGRSTERDVLDVERLAAARDVAVRSRSALRRLVRQIRGESLSPPSDAWHAGTVAIETVAIEMAVEHEGAVSLPLATLVFHPGSGSVLEAVLSMEPASPDRTAAAIVRWLDRDPEGADATRIDRIEIDADRRPGWAELFAVLERHGVARSGRRDRSLLGGPLVAATFGLRVLDLRIRPKMTHRRSGDRRPLPRAGRLNAPLTLDQAQAAVDERIRAQDKPDLTVEDARGLVADLTDAFSPTA